MNAAKSSKTSTVLNHTFEIIFGGFTGKSNLTCKSIRSLNSKLRVRLKIEK